MLFRRGFCTFSYLSLPPAVQFAVGIGLLGEGMFCAARVAGIGRGTGMDHAAYLAYPASYKSRLRKQAHGLGHGGFTV